MRLDAAGHHLVGGEITTHRIERDFHGETGRQRLDVQVAHGLGVRLDESLAGIDVGAHQDIEDLVRFDRIFDLDAEQHPVLWVHGRFPQLVGVHFTETLVAGDLRLSRHLGQLPILPLFGVGVTDLFPASDLVERRLCDIEVLPDDHLRHVAEEEGQQQRPDVRSIDVGVSHQNYMVISQFIDVKFLADAGTKRGDQVADLLRGEDLVFAGLFDVEDLATQRQDRLEPTVAGALRRTTRGITLDHVDFAQARVPLRAVGQLAGQRRRFEQRLALHQLPGTLCRVTGARGDQAFLDDSPRIRRALFEVLRERIGEHRLDLTADLRVAQLGLRLTLELRLANFYADHRGQPLAYVVAREVGVLIPHQVRLARVFVQDRRQRRAEAGDVTATLDRVDVVGKGEDVLGETLVVLQRDLHRVLFDLALDMERPQVDPSFVAVQVFDEGADTALEVEGVVEIDALIAQQDGQRLVEEGKLAQPVGHDVPVKAELFEDFRIRPESNVGAGGIGLADDLQGRDGCTATVFLVMLLAVPHDGDLQPLGERVDDREPDTVQPARHLVAAAAELSTGV